MNVKNNKTKNESSRIFSTTENTSSYKDDRFRIDTNSEEYQALSSQTHAKVQGEMTPSEAWYCMEFQVKNAFKVEDGLLDVIERLQRNYAYLSMAYDIRIWKLERKINQKETEIDQKETEIEINEREIKNMKDRAYEIIHGDIL